MSRIKSKNTKPELLVRRYLFSKGLRYRLHDRSLPGTPDIILKRFKTVIFVHGCFWHGHSDCKYFTIPKTRSEIWREKINKNKMRDRESILSLEKNAWNVIIIYECELRSRKREITLKNVVQNIFNQLRN